MSRVEIEALKSRLKLDIDPADLERAFLHSSYVNESPDKLDSNERLEFLGDAVIDLAVSSYLFCRFQARSEGELTKIKSVVVSGPVLAEKAKELGLDRCLLLGKGEAEAGGRQRGSILAAAFEALVGVLFSCQGYEPARRFVLEQLKAEIDKVEHGQHRKDYKTLLQEEAQKLGLKPIYTLLSAEGLDHRKEFTVKVEVAAHTGLGRGRSKKEAEQAAAKQVYFKLAS